MGVGGRSFQKNRHLVLEHRGRGAADCTLDFSACARQRNGTARLHKRSKLDSRAATPVALVRQDPVKKRLEPLPSPEALLNANPPSTLQQLDRDRLAVAPRGRMMITGLGLPSGLGPAPPPRPLASSSKGYFAAKLTS